MQFHVKRKKIKTRKKVQQNKEQDKARHKTFSELNLKMVTFGDVLTSAAQCKMTRTAVITSWKNVNCAVAMMCFCHNFLQATSHKITALSKH